MKQRITYSLKSLVTELFCKVHNDEMSIPDAVDALMGLIEGDVKLPTEEEIVHSKVDPLFMVGVVPVMEYCEIQEIRPKRSGGWKYFVYNKKHTYSTGWVSEDELIKKISLEKEKI